MFKDEKTTMEEGDIEHVKTLNLTITIIQTKMEAHRFYAVLMQLGVKSCELHGDVTQALRYLALQRFRDNEVDVMVSLVVTNLTH